MTAPSAPPDSLNPGVDVTAAPRYRIVTDGLTFKAQKRGRFLWHDVDVLAGDKSATTLSDARVVMNMQIARDTHVRGGWRIVETRR